MQQEKCSHAWEMINISYGFVVTEKCYNCDKIATYFTFEHKPPMEEYREGDHFWNVMESAQSFRFDLKCGKCGLVEKFDKLMWLMLCTGCDETCEIDKVRRELEAERTWVYVAFGFLPVDEREQLKSEKIQFLEDYFNQRRKSSRSRIKMVSHDKIKNIATCTGVVIKDLHMLSLTPPPEDE